MNTMDVDQLQEKVNREVDSLLDELDQALVTVLQRADHFTHEELSDILSKASTAHLFGQTLQEGPFLGHYDSWTPENLLRVLRKSAQDMKDTYLLTVPPDWR